MNIFTETIENRFIKSSCIYIPDKGKTILAVECTTDLIDEESLFLFLSSVSFPVPTELLNISEKQEAQKFSRYLKPSTDLFFYYRDHSLQTKKLDYLQALSLNCGSVYPDINLYNMADFNDKIGTRKAEEIFGALGLSICLSFPKFDLSPQTILESIRESLVNLVQKTIQLQILLDIPEISNAFQVKSSIAQEYPKLYLKPDMTSAKLMSMICSQSKTQDTPFISLLYPWKNPENPFQTECSMADILVYYANLFYPHPNTQEAKNRILELASSLKELESRSRWNEKTQEKVKIGFTASIAITDKQGNPNGSYVKFSDGGIHGGIYNLPVYQQDLKEYHQKLNLLEEAKWILQNRLSIPDPSPFDFCQNIASFNFSDGTFHQYDEFIFTDKNEELHFQEYTKPTLFMDDGSLKTRYKTTFSGSVIHNDFKSYYPSLLSRLNSFGSQSVFEELYSKKSGIDLLLKENPDNSQNLKKERESLKLLLNSVSGAGDSVLYPDIFIPNKIYSARIIGQIILFIIVLALAQKGIPSVSINTDGIYCTGEMKVIQPVIQYFSKCTGIEIEPEPMELVSKTTNERLEINPEQTKILSGAGDDLSHIHIKPEKSQKCAPVVQQTFAYFLYWLNKNRYALHGDLDPAGAKNFIRTILNSMPKKEALHALSWTIKADSPSFPCIFTEDPYSQRRKTPVSLPKINRVFMIQKDASPSMSGTWHMAKIRSIPENRGNRENNWNADSVMKDNGTFPSKRQECFFGKFSMIPEEQNVLVYNEELSEDSLWIYDLIDLDAYALQLIKIWEKWKNDPSLHNGPLMPNTL